MSTYTVISKETFAALKGIEGARPSYMKFAASNGVNYSDDCFDLPGGEHIERATISPREWTCRTEYRLYGPVGVLVEKHAPTPRGFWTGRASDLDYDTLRRFEACKAAGGWEAARLYEQVWGKVSTAKEIEARKAAAAKMRFGRIG
jgi:hypothetical protein